MMKWDLLTKLDANVAGGVLALVAAVVGYTLFIHGSLTDVLARETTLAQYRGVRSASRQAISGVNAWFGAAMVAS